MAARAGSAGPEPFGTGLDESHFDLARPGCALTTGRHPGVHGDGPLNPGWLDDGLRALARARYIVLLRTFELRRPVLIPNPTTHIYDKFESGAVSGDVLVYEIASGDLVGGFPFDIANDDKVEVGDHSIDHDLLVDLNKRFDDLVSADFASVGAPLPPSFGED